MADSTWTPKLLQKTSGSGNPYNCPDEQSSLLPKSSTDDDEIQDTGDAKSPRKLWLAEARILIIRCIPVILGWALQGSMLSFSVLIVGRLSPEALATAAFRYIFVIATSQLVAVGGSTALGTLASSSYTGSKNLYDLGILLQRAMVVLTAFYIPVAILWFFSAPVFRLLGQEEFICEDSARFLTAYIPGGLGFLYFEVMKRYLIAQEQVRAGTYLGLLGAPLATGLSFWISFLLLILYARFIAGSDRWGGFTLSSFHQIGRFARLALLGIIQVGSSLWAFEIVIIAAGRLGIISLAAQSALATTDQLVATIPQGIGITTSARVGNLLGKREVVGAARSANCSAVLSMLVAAFVAMGYMLIRSNLARLFNNDEGVRCLTADVIPWVAGFQIANFLSSSAAGSLRGMGRHHVSAAMQLINYYLIALPLGTWLAFTGWGLVGLWVGLCGGLYITGFTEWSFVIGSNWE